MTKLAAYIGKELASVENPFATIRELGFEAVEIPGMFCPWPEDEAGLDEWAARLKASGLEPRHHCRPGHNRHFYSADEAARSQCLQETATDIEKAARLGCDVVLVHPSAAESDEDRCRVIAALATLSAQAEPLGVRLEMECGSGAFSGDPRELAGLCEAVPGVSIAMDLGHAARSLFCTQGQGTLADWLEAAAPHIRSFQFNDGVVGDDGRFAQTAVGKGELPIAGLMPRVLELACSWWTIEEINKIESLIESKQYLERLLEGSR